MKKIIVIVFLALLSCRPGLKSHETYYGDFIERNDFTVHGMKYSAYVGYQGESVFIINVTKDSLELQKLKLEIKYLKEQLSE